MDRKLLYKIVAIVCMSILLFVPLALIKEQISERSQRQEEVERSIAYSSAGPQTMIGPLIRIRYRERLQRTLRDPESKQLVNATKIVEHTQLVAPETLSVTGDAQVERRYRGIYQARLFHLDADSQSTFRVSVPAVSGTLVSAEATLILGLSDTRGVSNDPEVSINGQSYRFTAANRNARGAATATNALTNAATEAAADVASSAPGTPARGVETDDDALDLPTLSVPLGRLEAGSTHRFTVGFPLRLSGTANLSIAPVAESNDIRLKSTWLHPNFAGRFLPRERTVDGTGFAAHWEISHLARNFSETLNARGDEKLSISFIDPVNVYLLSERAVKHGVLFIALTFAGFFLTEILRRSPIHPLQYLLVGLALAIFFLLLIALSEHMRFTLAYALSATACITLIASYLAGVLGGWQRGAAFGAGLVGLYGVLYGVLHSEDNALLMGSLLLFLALGTVMLMTRRVDWYGLAQRQDDKR